MKNGEITVRFAAENELARVNELREQVSRLHAENRPDVFRPDFCNELWQIAKNAFDADDSDVVVACMDGDICGFAIPEYIERQESCCRRAEKFCRISEFGVDAALRRRGAAKDDSGAEMIRKIREAFFREMNVFNKRKCKKNIGSFFRGGRNCRFLFVHSCEQYRQKPCRGECEQKTGKNAADGKMS